MAQMPNTSKVDLQLQRRLLPIYTARDALIREIKSNISCVVVGETGSGKTTQIPQVLKAYPCETRLLKTRCHLIIFAYSTYLRRVWLERVQ
jgi:HrpA-like RNA helicase